MLRGIIFDLDGTLISLHVDGAAFRREIARELDSERVQNRFHGRQLQGPLRPGHARPWRGRRSPRGLVKVDYEQMRSRTLSALDALEVGWIRHSQLLPGAEAILSRLRRGESGAPITLALLTNSGRAATRYAMETLGFKRYFEKTFTRDDLPAMKPSPEGITAALKTLGLRQSEALYVGDSLTDIMATRGAGIRIASVATEAGMTEGHLRKLGALDYTLGSLSELEELLPRLG